MACAYNKVRTMVIISIASIVYADTAKGCARGTTHMILNGGSLFEGHF